MEYQDQQERQKRERDARAWKRIGLGAAFIAVAAVGWFYLIPLLGLEVVSHDWFTALGFAATLCLAYFWDRASSS